MSWPPTRPTRALTCVSEPSKALITELSLNSDDFRWLWADHDVLSSVSGSDLYVHPAVGWMRLSFQTFAVGGTDGQTLFADLAQQGPAE